MFLIENLKLLLNLEIRLHGYMKKVMDGIAISGIIRLLSVDSHDQNFYHLICLQGLMGGTHEKNTSILYDYVYKNDIL